MDFWYVWWVNEEEDITGVLVEDDEFYVGRLRHTESEEILSSI